MEAQLAQAKGAVSVFGHWQTKLSETPVQLARPFVDMALARIKRWALEFPNEGSLAEEIYEVPTVLASMNCVVSSRGRFEVISISPNPSNVGIAATANHALKLNLDELKNAFGGLVAVHADKDDVPDDSCWIDSINPKQAQFGNYPFIVRSRTKNEQFSKLYSKSLSPIEGRNSNIYGVALKMWRSVNSDNLNELPWEGGFALRYPSNLGKIYLYAAGFRSLPGLSTEKKIEDAMNNYSGHMYVQKFIHPMRSPIGGENMVFKLYFGFFPRSGYRYLGGVWMSRKGYLVHGTPETTFGPLE